MCNRYRMLQVVVLLLATFVALSCQAQEQASSAPTDQNTTTAGPLEGVWRVSEVTTTGPNATTNASPQPGFYIFTERHYSIVTVNSPTPRPSLPQDTNTATAAQLNAVYGGFTGQTGTYEISGSTLTTRPFAAMNPAVMAAGNFATRSFNVEGDTLTLTLTANTNGPAANPTTTKLTRVE
jgi:hypothetical protein